MVAIDIRCIGKVHYLSITMASNSAVTRAVSRNARTTALNLAIVILLLCNYPSSFAAPSPDAATAQTTTSVTNTITTVTTAPVKKNYNSFRSEQPARNKPKRSTYF